jgi:hypothetical protein
MHAFPPRSLLGFRMFNLACYAATMAGPWPPACIARAASRRRAAACSPRGSSGRGTSELGLRYVHTTDYYILNDHY